MGQVGFGPGFVSIFPERMRIKLKRLFEFGDFGENLGLMLKMLSLDLVGGPEPLVVRRL